MAVVETSSATDTSRSARAPRLLRRDGDRALSCDQLALALDRLRAGVIADKRRAFPSLPVQEIENLYGDACEDALDCQFTDIADIAAYVRRHVHNRAITLKQSPAVARRVLVAGERADVAPGPFEQVVQSELVAVLREFLAEQTVADRNVVWLFANGQRPAQIARALGVSRSQATADCKRLRSSLERFVALQTRPAAICARRREDVLAWRETGRMPLALRWHLRWHHACGLVETEARQAVQHALLPLAPAACGLAHFGLLCRMYQAILTHRVTAAAHHALARVRRLAPAGGGSAAAGAGAIKVAAIIGAGVGAVYALAATPADHTHHTRARVIAHVAAATTPPTTVPAATTPTAPPPTTTAAAPPPSTTTQSSTTTSTSRPAAPDSGTSTPPSTGSGSTSAPSSSSPTPVAAHDAAASPTGGGSAPSGGGQGTSSTLGGGGTPP